MNTCIEFLGKSISLTVTPPAERALQQRNTPLQVEMELYFSCLIRKAVRFYEAVSDRGVPVNESLSLSFRPVMTKQCGLDFSGDEPALTDFPIKQPERYIPHWLHIDYRNRKWHGEFGYTRS